MNLEINDVCESYQQQIANLAGELAVREATIKLLQRQLEEMQAQTGKKK